MSFSELVCEDCNLYFELGTSREINLGSILCIECASTKVRILSHEEEAHSRLEKVMQDIEDLKKRIEIMSDDSFIMKN